MPEELPAWWTWLTLLDLGMRCDRDRVEAAHLAHRREGRLELRQRLHRRGRAHVLVLGRGWSGR
jgi:hypothetical protein